MALGAPKTAYLSKIFGLSRTHQKCLYFSDKRSLVRVQAHFKNLLFCR